MNIFKKMYYACLKPKSYKELIKSSTPKTFLYGLFIFFMTFIIIAFYNVLVIRSNYGSLSEIIKKNVPEFTLENGKLSVEKEILYNNNGIYVNIDTSKEGAFAELNDDKIKRMVADYSSVMIIDSSRAVLANQLQYNEIDFSKLSGSFNKAKLLEVVPEIRNLIILTLALTFVFLLIMYYVVLFFFAFISSLYAFFSKKIIRFNDLYKMAIYASTLPCIILIVNDILPFRIMFLPYILIYIILFLMQRAISGVDSMIKAYSIKNEEDFKNMLNDLRNDAKKDNIPDDIIDKELGKIPSYSQLVGEKEVSTEENTEEHYRRNQPEVIKPSSGFSFGKTSENNDDNELSK